MWNRTLILGLVLTFPAWAGLGKAMSLTSGPNTACGIFEETPGASTRVVRCWNASGEVAIPHSLSNPTQVALWHDICTLDDSGIQCFGALTGEYPVPTLDKPNFVSVAGGHFCAIDKSGLKCWGWDDPWIGLLNAPKFSATAVSAGGKFNCAINSSDLNCWGRPGRYVPKSVTNPTKLVISGGGSGTACLLSDDGVNCFNEGGRLGFDPSGATWGPKGTIDFCLSDFVGCYLRDGDVNCNGHYLAEYGVTPVPAFTAPTAVSCGNSHACVIDGGQVHCWGTVTDANIPTA